MLARKDDPSFFPSLVVETESRPQAQPFKLEVTAVGKMVNVTDMTDAVRTIETALRQSAGFLFFTLNLDHLTKMKRYESFRKLYEQATFVSADGWPVALLTRRKDAPVRRTTGADLVMPVCAMAAVQDVPVYLFGSTPETLASAAAKLTARFPGLRIVGQEAPPFAFDPQSDSAKASAAAIAASGARLCFVALGAPTQEAFSAMSRQVCPSVGFLCVGAALDFIAGAQRRAPRVLQKLGLEWAWRWSLSPRRLTRRYLQCIAVFAELGLAKLVQTTREA